jgi:hypothetical protein
MATVLARFQCWAVFFPDEPRSEGTPYLYRPASGVGALLQRKGRNWLGRSQSMRVHSA